MSVKSDFELLLDIVNRKKVDFNLLFHKGIMLDDYNYLVCERYKLSYQEYMFLMRFRRNAF